MAAVLDRDEDPSAAEMRDGLTVLQSLYDGWLHGGMFGRLTDVYEPGDYEAGEGERVYIEDGTVTLPTEIDDRKPRDLVAIEVFDDDGRKAWVWDRNAWVRIDSLTENDAAPLAARGMNGLAACVAVNYVEEFGEGTITQSMVRQCGQFKAALSYKFGSEREVSVGTWF